VSVADPGRAWLKRLGRAAYHAAPPRFWRSVDGLKRDLASLPARLRDPARRREPWEVVHHVGGEYAAAGRNVLGMLRAQGGLQPNDRVLDIGCGNGRVSWPLAEVLGPDGGYVGFDVSRAAIRYCRRRISPVRPDFAFHHLDIRNGIYNPKGRIEEVDTRFPCADQSVTLAFATSVLTHLPWPTIQRYLAETHRVLAPGGRALLTAFVLTPQVRAWAAEGRTRVPLQPYGEAMTSDPHWPENAMAYDETAFRAAADAAGLELTAVLAGQWRPEPQFAGGQDLLILRRPG
jgi:ubiquinone/menaquinone biosynthesis C-methylase UbiE